MATTKPKKESSKNKKLTLKKGTVRDLTARRDAADAIRGGNSRGCDPGNNSFNPNCSY